MQLSIYLANGLISFEGSFLFLSGAVSTVMQFQHGMCGKFIDKSFK